MFVHNTQVPSCALTHLLASQELAASTKAMNVRLVSWLVDIAGEKSLEMERGKKRKNWVPTQEKERGKKEGEAK